MKKIKAILTAISMIVVSVSTVISASAENSYIKYYDTTYAYENGTISPRRVCEKLTYDGIVVTMPDESEPTSEKMGVDCIIRKYEAYNYGLINKIDEVSDGWCFEESVAPTENQYKIYTSEIMTEEEAIKFSEKLMIQGVVEKAEVAYIYQKSYGTLNHHFLISFNDKEKMQAFELELYPEIRETLKYNDYKYGLADDHIWINCDVNNSNYIGDTGINEMDIFNDIAILNSKLTEKYNEINSIDIQYVYEYSDGYNNAVYSVVPTWGDATNDDIINLYDAIEISKHIMGIGELDEDTILLADINRDGATNLYDAVEIAKILML